MSSLTRLLSVLDLFSEETPLLDAETIAQQLELSIPTAYRYIKELTSTGILTKTGNEYGLGPRIIQLDHQMQKCDQLIHQGRPIAHELSEITNSTVLLTSVYGDETINVYEASSDRKIHPSFGRGHKMPLAKGASARIILAFMKRTKLKKLYEKHIDNQDIQQLGADWTSFQKNMNELRRKGYEISEGELDTDLFGIAAPIVDADGNAYAALTIIMPIRKARLYDWQTLADHVMQQTAQISKAMLELKSA